MFQAFFGNFCGLFGTLDEKVYPNDGFFFHLLAHDQWILFQFEYGRRDRFISKHGFGTMFGQLSKVADDGVGEFSGVQRWLGFVAKVASSVSLLQGIE